MSPSLSAAVQPLDRRTIRLLITAHDQEQFLHELEHSPPPWDRLHDRQGEGHGERLFRFNRQRDAARMDHPLLRQRLAFLWAGVLRRYVPEYHGFTLAMGPVFTSTTWGLVRFKPIGLPDEMIAVPPPDLLPHLRTKLLAGDRIEIDILFTGHLVPDESLLYAFSHDGTDQGVIMPIVLIDGVHYALKAPPSP
ncbi:MAG: hypothetical protein D6704_10835 [Nitrospirae bacterium]|nr:MAG: hypothetical protein D6704_10835 [Nitrospirota bacterium]